MSPGRVGSTPFPQPGAPTLFVPVAKSSGVVGSAGAASAVLPGAAGLTTYISGFDITGLGATSVGNVTVTVTGLQTQTGTLSFSINVPAGATVPLNATTPNGGYAFRFPEPLPASAQNSAITVSVPSLGSGNTVSCVTAYGYQF